LTAILKGRILTIRLTDWAGGSRSTHLAFLHSQAVKARRIAAWAGFATAAVRRVVMILGFVIRTFVRRAAIIGFFRGGHFLTGGRGVERLSVVAIAARILATARLLTWSREWRNIRLRCRSRWAVTIASHR
jgi:hypothetical protein